MPRGGDLVRRNVSALVDTPHGREGRPSQPLTVEQAAAQPEPAPARERDLMGRQQRCPEHGGGLIACPQSLVSGFPFTWMYGRSCDARSR